MIERTKDEGSAVTTPGAHGEAPAMSAATGGNVGARSLVLGVVSAAVGAVPIPIVPTQVQRAIRSALAHDLARRHGLVLTPAARARLGEPSAAGVARGFGAEAARYVARRIIRRWTLVGALAGPAREGAETIALGRLFERYLDVHRAGYRWASEQRIGEEEATAVRHAIDVATTHAWLPSDGPGERATSSAVEDLRGAVERTTDRLILAIAAVPDAVSSRLDVAFDKALRDALGEPTPAENRSMVRGGKVDGR